ncbi:hypothetical protein GCM10010215_65410 [Streptomyces virginiae]|uniref:Uncharacterized protein n=1 Tax=Streptomyces virginiae TaxID=1961 RepID=A0ABQ3NMR2_STRVG|nr:hypothetical protein GCM10010215_65410 [Streptomyces virginiae]GHI14061.1 hypothetical protein Scinn_35240 [Streptomyces virginiae]
MLEVGVVCHPGPACCAAAAARIRSPFWEGLPGPPQLPPGHAPALGNGIWRKELSCDSVAGTTLIMIVIGPKLNTPAQIGRNGTSAPRVSSFQRRTNPAGAGAWGQSRLAKRRSR